MSVLAPAPTGSLIHPPKPGGELGAETQQVGGIAGWGSFVDQLEYVPELAWPASIWTYHKMRSDSQVDSLHIGTVQPVREFRWSIDPNGAPAGLVEQLAGDMGLPVRGHEDDNTLRGPRQFDFDQFLDDCLLAPLYGHFHFEIVGQTDGAKWSMVKLAPRHPRTIMEFQSDLAGDLLAVRQNISGAQPGGWARLPPPIPAGKLVAFVWRKEAGSHVGRSLLRSMFREWLVKDRVIRVAAINLERAGGMPVIEGPQGASDSQLRDLATLARSFKVAEGGGGAIPYGSKLTLVGGAVPEAINLLEYCDQAMARVWSLMLIQLGLGSTSSGNRALGGEFALYAARAQRAMAKWVCRSVNDFFDRYTEWNLGEAASHAPLLHYEQDRPDSMSVAELVALIEAGALTTDPELESWLRSEHGLPVYTPPADPELGDLTPDEVALVQNSRNPPPPPGTPGGPVALPKPNAPQSPGDVQQMQTQTLASGPLDTVTLALPDRKLRRQPNQHEIAARMDLRTIDAQHQTVTQALQAAFAQQVIPAQIRAVGAQVLTTKAGTARKTVTRAAMASLTAPASGQDVIAQHLATAAQDGAHAAAAELAAQGVTASIPSDQDLSDGVGEIAAAAATLAATSLTLSAQRKGTQLAGTARTPQEAHDQLTSYLSDLKYSWTGDQLQGAVTAAQNSGRIAVFTSILNQDAVSYYASEILDVNTCDACASVDGTQYSSLADAQNDYGSGGYVDCAGGPRCRGTLVAVYSEQDPSSSSNPVLSGVVD